MGRLALCRRHDRPDTVIMSRVLVPLLAAAVGVTSLVGGPLLGRAQSVPPNRYSYCPPAGNLITPKTAWHHRQLAPGVSLSSTQLGHGKRRLEVNVVRANLRRERVAVAPLHRRLTHRRRLTSLARQRHLVAATNGPYFSFGFGAPTVPVIGRGGPLVLSAHHQRIAGLGDDNRARDGKAWLVGHVTSEAGRIRLVGLNEVLPPPGLSLYTAAWGRHKVPRPRLSRAVVVRNGHVVPGTGRRQRVPRHGVLLVASSLSSLGWLDDLRRNSEVAIAYHANANTHHPFRQAYGVGTRTVSTRHHVRHGLYCNRNEIYAARTDIAWRRHGSELLLATVASPRGSERHGVDENQMSEIMAGLGADRAYALDGGGSTDMVARLRHHGLRPISPLYKGRERPVPVGVGVFTVPKSVIARRHRQQRRHHHHHHRHHHGGPHKHKCLLGPLLCH
jgi:hypothetical protein